jgi:hypothetical protein
VVGITRHWTKYADERHTPLNVGAIGEQVPIALNIVDKDISNLAPAFAQHAKQLLIDRDPEMLHLGHTACEPPTHQGIQQIDMRCHGR